MFKKNQIPFSPWWWLLYLPNPWCCVDQEKNTDSFILFCSHSIKDKISAGSRVDGVTNRNLLSFQIFLHPWVALAISLGWLPHSWTLPHFCGRHLTSCSFRIKASLAFHKKKMGKVQSSLAFPPHFLHPNQSVRGLATVLFHEIIHGARALWSQAEVPTKTESHTQRAMNHLGLSWDLGTCVAVPHNRDMFLLLIVLRGPHTLCQTPDSETPLNIFN